MSRKSLFGFVALALCLVCSLPLVAQNLGSTRGNLAGTVFDPSKALISGASVTVIGPLGSLNQTTTAQGTFLFTGLVPGTYRVKVEKEGFKATLLPSVTVLINNTATVNVTLETGSVSTTVEVTSSAMAVDTNNSSVNSNLDDTFYNSVPVKRNVSSVMLMAPGAVSGLGTGLSTSMGSMRAAAGGANTDANPSISGASGLENLYVADGVILNDASFGGLGSFSTVYGALGAGITPAFVKEVEVKTAAFEPQFGHSTGGVVQIVTKSGSRQMHGTIGGYFQLPGMESEYANKDSFGPVNLSGVHHNNGNYEGDFELGGYVPGLRDHLFYFGAFNPTFFHNYVSPAVNSGLYQVDPNVDRITNTFSYAAKLTYQVNNSVTAESSVFGDPARTNHVPWSTLAASNTTGNSKWDFGSRNWDTRIQAAISPTWTLALAYTYAWNHFTETPQDTSLYSILDQTQSAGLPGQAGEFQAQWLSEPITNSSTHTQTASFDTSKIFHFAGNHTISVGYFWQNPRYDATTKYSYPTFTIPGTNATGGDPGTAAAAGQTSDAALELQIADPTIAKFANCTLCPLMNVPGYATPQPVVLYQVRGRFDGGITATTGKYHAAYINDAWEMSKYATLNLGLRWEQQRMNGSAADVFLNDQWSPRIGFIVDPTGDRKSKIYTQFSRLAYVLPLDLAVRELSSEDDNLNDYWAPASDSSGMVTLNQFGTVNFVPDAAHLLNNAVGGVSKPVSIEIQSGGEPFTPGLRMEYNDEFVVGAEHEFSGGFFASVRYIDRRMKRVIEDEVGQSVEQLTALAFNGGSYSYVIGNPSANQAVFVTPNEQVFGQVDDTAFSAALKAATTMPSAANAAALEALGYPSACVDANNVPTPYNAPNNTDTFGNFVGSACFPTVNGTVNGDPAALYGGEYFPNGCQYCKPGLYPNVQRNYQAIEFEVNKSFANNWMLRSNFRVARLAGNYEGAYRNDNNQSDPGISSLFDLTNGDLGLLGQQLGIGPLNTDRKYVLNVFPSYTIPGGFAKNLVLGAAVSVQSGIPLTTLAAQEIYGNAGEVPLHGRGDLGFSPVTGTVSAHLEYPVKFGESKQLKFQFDAFNIANTKRQILSTEFVDLSFGVPNVDFANHVPLTFVAPFSARASVAFTF
jgi:Carboxypeptidase regulatory-like domain